jgi:hypothetical protein
MIEFSAFPVCFAVLGMFGISYGMKVHNRNAVIPRKYQLK